MITEKQAIEAIKTIKEYCIGRGGLFYACATCPVVAWCKRFALAPDGWDVPQERREDESISSM